MQMFSYLKEKKGAGFYLSAIAAILSLIVAILYVAVFNASAYMNWVAFILPLVACIAFFVLSAFKATAPFSSLVMGLLNFVAFLIFIRASYLIYSEIFFGGFSWVTILEARSICYFICTLLYIASIVLSNIGFYLKHDANS
ncbi:MAG: hypothetical protein E7370_02165 [Clostridiales bacterium]|nr:hypothetical protein [Clostridiales bacterium]